MYLYMINILHILTLTYICAYRPMYQEHHLFIKSQRLLS